MSPDTPTGPPTIADHKAGVFRVNAIHPDTEITPAMNAAIDSELHDLADWLDLPLERPDD
jgi:hypothetical protein